MKKPEFRLNLMKKSEFRFKPEDWHLCKLYTITQHYFVIAKATYPALNGGKPARS